MPIYNNEGVVMVTPSATSPALAEGQNYAFIIGRTGRVDFGAAVRLAPAGAFGLR